MEIHAAKRVAIVIEAPAQKKLCTALEAAGVTGYTILPVLGGSGASGRWTREGLVGSAGGMVQIVCIIRPERLDALLEAVFDLVSRQIGVISVMDCGVLRAERF